MINKRLLCVSIIAINFTSATLAHYADFWVVGYFFGMISTLLILMIFES